MMFSGDEDYGDEITSGLDSSTVSEFTCEECGAPTAYILCRNCQKELEEIENPEPDSDRTLGLNRSWD